MRTREELLEEARRRGLRGMDAYNAADDEDSEQVSNETPDVEGPPTADEMRAAIGGTPAVATAPEASPAAEAPEFSMEALTARAQRPVQTSAAPESPAAQARRLLGSLSTKRQAPSALPEALKHDAENAKRTRVSDFLRAAFTRRPVQFSPAGPGEADQVRAAESSQQLQDQSAERRAALLGSLEPKPMRPVDPSLAERRLALTEEAKNRSKLSQLQLEALERDRLRKSGMGEAELEERIRHNKAVEESKKKPGGPHPVTGVKAGDITTVPAQYREVVKGIAEGRMEAPKAASRFGADILKYVVAYKPDFDATKFGAYKKVVEQQTSGKDVVAIDVAREHMKTAKSLIPANSDIQLINKYKQAFATGSGDPQFTAFVAASNVAAHELAKVYGIEDQAGKQMVEHMMASAQSPAQLAAVFDTLDELIAGKQRGLERQKAAVAPGGAPSPAAHGETPEPTALKTRKTKGGVTAYQGVKDPKRWWSTPEEAKAN